LKNRPELGERTLQKLVSDKLIKYNYFLTDIRARNVKSYMKLPIPGDHDPAKEIFLSKLIKHVINIEKTTVSYMTNHPFYQIINFPR
jgi:hypothetical protein